MQDALAMAFHPRVGARSWIRMLPYNALQNIMRQVKHFPLDAHVSVAYFSFEKCQGITHDAVSAMAAVAPLCSEAISLDFRHCEALTAQGGRHMLSRELRRFYCRVSESMAFGLAGANPSRDTLHLLERLIPTPGVHECETVNVNSTSRLCQARGPSQAC